MNVVIIATIAINMLCPEYFAFDISVSNVLLITYNKQEDSSIVPKHVIKGKYYSRKKNTFLLTINKSIVILSIVVILCKIKLG